MVEPLSATPPFGPLLPPPRRAAWSGRLVPDGPLREALDARLGSEAFELRLADSGLSLAAGDAAGLAYGRACLGQVRRLAARAGTAGLVPEGEVSDRPAFGRRAVLLDVSRDKVPTLETLAALVERLASLRCNELHLYVEHTFAYPGHEEVWEGSGALGAPEVEEIDRHCRSLHVELVPNRNCLGHFERFLWHPRYRRLAAPGSRSLLSPEPTTLDPSCPEAFALARELLAGLLPCFTSRRVHLGCDEPYGLLPERLGEYQDWVARLAALPELDGRERGIWGDVVALFPELLGSLPEGLVVYEWGYEADHPFDERLARLAQAGVARVVCPGTSSWISLGGRVPNALENCRRAARSALEHGASGICVTDWGDLGHHQHLPIAEAMLAWGLANAWNPEATSDLDLAAALDAHVFEDDQGRFGQALLDLGSAYARLPCQFPNLATLSLPFYLPQLPAGSALTEGLRPEHLDAAEDALEAAARQAHGARPRRADGALLLEEVESTARLLRLCARDARERLRGDGSLASLPEAVRRTFADEASDLAGAHRRLWLARNRPGGLRRSLAWFSHLEDCYRSGWADPDWSGPPLSLRG